MMTAALAMMAMTANAQSMKHINMNASSQTWAETSTPQKVENSTRKVATRAGSDIADNQRYINYSYDESYVWPATFPADTQGAISLGTLFYSDAFKKFEGCKIVGARFYVNIPIGASKVGVCHVKIENNIPYVGDILASKDVPSTVAHWNYVWFDEPYKIDTKNFDGLLPYYDFTPSNMSADAGYPIASSGTWAGTCGALAYGDVDGKHDQSTCAWQPIYLGTDVSNLMIQLIIEKEDGNFILHDLVMDKIAMSPFVKNDTKTGVASSCHNDGRDNITNVKFGIEVDGEKIGTFTYNKDNVGDNFREITNADYSNIPVGLPIDKDWTIGEHEVTVYPVLVEGKEPAGDLTNDKLTTKEGQKWDIWLHTQKIHGSHVLLCTDGAEPDETSLQEAAVLAAYYSQARDSSKVPVDYTPVKFVKKPAASRPGMVVYTTYQTMYVDPDMELVKRLRVK